MTEQELSKVSKLIALSDDELQSWHSSASEEEIADVEQLLDRYEEFLFKNVLDQYEIKDILH